MYCDCNRIFYLFPVLSHHPDRKSIFGKRKRPVLSVCGKISPNLHADDFANGIQPMSAGFFTSMGKARLGVIMSLTGRYLPVATDRHLPLPLWNRWCHVRRTDCRYLRISYWLLFLQTELGIMKAAEQTA